MGSEHFQSIRKGICSQPIFRKNYRLHAILTILLLFQVNQEVLPQYSVSWRISSPLTTSKRVPYHWLPAEGLDMTPYILYIFTTLNWPFILSIEYMIIITVLSIFFLLDWSPFLGKCHFSAFSVREIVMLQLSHFVWNMLFDIPL